MVSGLAVREVDEAGEAHGFSGCLVLECLDGWDAGLVALELAEVVVVGKHLHACCVEEVGLGRCGEESGADGLEGAL